LFISTITHITLSSWPLIRRCGWEVSCEQTYFYA